MSASPNSRWERAPRPAAPPVPALKPAIISARGLTRVFGSGARAVTAVKDVTLDIQAGEFLVVRGRSGSGKTTLLNLLARLDRPTAGRVLFEGQDLESFSEAALVELRRRKIGFVFQSFGLIPLLSAQENVELPLHISRLSWRERRRRAREWLALVGLEARARHRPYELSGGEQQRVAIARALVAGPDVVFADEPTGELDTATGISIITMMREMARQRAVTLVVTTHDPTVAGMGSRTVELEDGRLLPTAGAPPLTRGE